MATLTEISSIARKGIKIGVVVLVVLMLIPGTVNLVKNLYKRLNPPPPPPPTVRYGKLPKLIFPKTESSATPEYKLETITGGLPAGLPNTAKVYLVAINKSRLMEEDRVRTKARVLGFTSNFVRVDDQVYRFVHQTIPAEMVVNGISGGFSYRLDWTQDKSIYSTFSVPLGTQAVNEARDWLTSLGLLPKDLVDGVGKFSYLVATGSAMVPTELFYEANFTRVDLFRDKLDELKIWTAGGDKSPVSVIISGLEKPKKIVAANYHYSQIVENEFATYPLKGVQQAWLDLSAGGGYIAKRSGPEVIVRRAELGYYESNDPQGFLQPIYIFEGDGGFVGYVQAIADQYVQ